MELTDFINLLKKRKKTIISFIVLFLVIIVIFIFTQPLKYSAKTRLLVVQSASGADPYTVSKSNEYLGNLFSQVVYSNSFFNLVMTSDFNIDGNYFGDTTNKQMKTWKKTVDSRSLGDTGIISITVYHPDPEQAKQIALAINDVLMNKNFNYQGLGNLVRVTVIDQPITSNYPVKPNIVLNVILSVFAGLIVSLIYIYIFPETKPKEHKKYKKRKKKKEVIHYEHITIEDNNQKKEKEEDNVSIQDSGNINNILNNY